MDGTIAPLADIVEVAKRYNALTYVDEVHAVGLYGREGAGIAAAQGVDHDVDFIQGTFAKAFGVMGGYVAGSRRGIDFIRSFAPGFIFTTALSPVLANAALESIKHVRNADGLRNMHKRQVERLKEALRSRRVSFRDEASHIVPVVIGDAFATREAARLLMERYRIYVQPIFSPTVELGTARLRLTPTPLHTDHMIDELADALVDVLVAVQSLSWASYAVA